MKNLLVILILYICQSSNAQTQTTDFLVTNIHKDFNLTTSGFRDVFIDQVHRKWIASTSAGLSMFDGRKFHRYTTQDGMSSNFVFRVSQDSEGSIWAATANGVSCLNHSGKIVNYLKGTDGKNNFFTHFIEDRNNRKYAMGFAGLFTLKDSNWTKIDSVNKFLFALAGKKDTTWFMREDALFYTTAASAIPAFYMYTATKRNYKIYLDAQHQMWVMAFDGIGFYRNGTYQKVNDVLGFFSMAEYGGKYFLGSNGDGLFTWSNADTGIVRQTIFKKMPIMGIMPEKGGLWVLGVGIYLLHQETHRPYASSKRVDYAKYVTLKSHVYIDDVRRIYYDQDGKNKFLFSLSDNPLDMLKSAYLDGDNLYISTQFTLFRYSVLKGQLQEVKTPSLKSTYDYVKFEDRIYIARDDGFFQMSGDSIINIPFPDSLKETSKVSALAVFGNQIFVLKTGVGMFSYRKGKFSKLNLPAELLYQAVISMTVSKDSAKSLNYLLMLHNAGMNTACISNEGQLADWKSVGHDFFEVEAMPMGFIKNTNGIWYNRKNEFFRVDVSNLGPMAVEFGYKLSSKKQGAADFNGWVSDSSSQYVLSTNERNVSFEWITPTIYESGKYLVKWEMEGGASGNSGANTDGSFDLSFANPGGYRLHCYLVDVLNNRVVKQVVLQLTVQPFWYETIWFKTLLFLILAFVIVSITYFTVKRNGDRKLENIQKEIAFGELRSKALQNIITPHLLFNLFNNIQSKVMNDRKDQAIAVLSTLSDFIRRSLQFSKQDLVLLSEEVELVSQYVQLEVSRNNLDDFEFRIQNNSGIQLDDISFPSMLLQPLVENAIKYGGPKNKISIDISKPNGALVVSVVNTVSDFDSDVRGTGIGLSLVTDKLNLIQHKYNKAGSFSSAAEGEGYRSIITF